MRPNKKQRKEGRKRRRGHCLQGKLGHCGNFSLFEGNAAADGKSGSEINIGTGKVSNTF